MGEEEGGDHDNDDDGDDDMIEVEEKQRELKEYILGEHYLMDSKLAERAQSELTAPQWIQCSDCKKWRVIPVPMDKVKSGGLWMDEDQYIGWKCSDEDGMDCDSVQMTPNKKTH